MAIRHYLRCYAVTALVFLGLDAIWLSVIEPAYRAALGDMMRTEPLWPVAIGFYVVFVIGLLIFAVYPARSAARAGLLGALFGAFTYGTYELTNLALLAGWPAWLAVADIIWGSALCATAAVSGYFLR